MRGEETAAEMFEEKHRKSFSNIGPEPKPAIRTFDTGATRDKEDHKNDYEGFFSPLVFRRYGDYMQEHRKQKDGSVRDSDNWQKGMGLSAFMKSKWRHFMDIWTIFDGYKAIDFDGAEVDLEDALCADLFNTMGYLHEVLKAKLEKLETIRATKYKAYGPLPAEIPEEAYATRRKPYEDTFIKWKHYNKLPLGAVPEDPEKSAVELRHELFKNHPWLSGKESPPHETSGPCECEPTKE